MSINATNAMLNPSTFKTEAALNRRSTLKKFRKIVFIFNCYLFTFKTVYNLNHRNEPKKLCNKALIILQFYLFILKAKIMPHKLNINKSTT
jgi:hypothetical protein